MELMYLYIAETKVNRSNIHSVDESGKAYKTIKNCGFNFSNNYKITTIFKKSSNKYVVSYSKNNLDEKFYNSSGYISSVTALVGENGSGKTSIMEFISDILKNKLIERKGLPEYFIVFGENNLNTEPKFVIIRSQFINIEICGISKVQQFQSTEILSDILFLKYSNSIEDYHYNPLSFDSMGEVFKDLSTGYLLREASFLNKSRTTDMSRVMLEFRQFEVSNQLQFVVDFNNKIDFGFKTPEYLKLLLSTNETESYIENGVNNADRQSFDLVQKLHELVVKVTSKISNSAKESFILRLYFEVFLNVFRNYESMIWIDDAFKSSFKNIENSYDYAKLRSLLNTLIRYILTKNKQPISSIKSFFEQIQLISETSFSDRSGMSLIIEVNQNTISFMQLYFNTYLYRDVFNYSWLYDKTSALELSSGENVLFSFFSRLNYAKHNQKLQNPIDSKSIILFIDEGDQFLHPNWQRMFMKTLLDYVPQIFSQSKSIQLILTTHSPFILSDIRFSDIVFLKKNKSGLTEIYKDDSIGETFGANIHALLSHGFFMSEGLNGEFAKQKIKGLIRFFHIKSERGREVGFDKDSSKLLIDSIGEPVLKKHLQNLWEKEYAPELHSTSKEELLERIAKLEIENKKLKDETYRY